MLRSPVQMYPHDSCVCVRVFLHEYIRMHMYLVARSTSKDTYCGNCICVHRCVCVYSLNNLTLHIQPHTHAYTLQRSYLHRCACMHLSNPALPNLRQTSKMYEDKLVKLTSENNNLKVSLRPPQRSRCVACGNGAVYDE